METGIPLECLATIVSTSESLKARAAAGSGEVALLAQEQTGGRGRHGRVWRSIDGNLHLSVLLRPGTFVAPGHWSLMAAVCLADVVRACVPVPGQVRLKWPNDVMLDGGKLAGVLLEAGGAPAPWLVIGFGVNLAGAPDGLGRPTACVAQCAPPPPPVAFAHGLLASLAGWRARYLSEGFGPVRRAWLDLGPPAGAPISIALGGERIDGRFAGIGAAGELLVDQPGRRRVLVAGEVG